MWELSGYYEFHASMGMNYAHTILRGPNNIKFEDGSVIRYNTFEWNVHGTVKGDRLIEVVNSMVFEDLTHGIKALVCFNTTKSKSYFSWATSGSLDGIEGLIYVSTEQPPLTPTLFGPKQKLTHSVSKLKDVKEKLSVISGSWLDKLCFDDQVWWDLHEFEA